MDCLHYLTFNKFSSPQPITALIWQTFLNKPTNKCLFSLARNIHNIQKLLKDGRLNFIESQKQKQGLQNYKYCFNPKELFQSIQIPLWPFHFVKSKKYHARKVLWCQLWSPLKYLTLYVIFSLKQWCGLFEQLYPGLHCSKVILHYFPVLDVILLLEMCILFIRVLAKIAHCSSSHDAIMVTKVWRKLS